MSSIPSLNSPSARSADLGNLRQRGVRALRNTAKAADRPPAAVQRFSVDALKNGGSMDLGSAVAGAPRAAENAAAQGEAVQSGGLRGREQTLRQRYRGGGPAPSARAAQNSKLSTEEQVEKLGQIRKSATQYESVFVDSLVKQMRQSPLTETPGGDTFSEIAEQPFRDFLSQAGGLGLANSIVSQVARQEGLEQTLHEHPDIMGPDWRPTVPRNLMKKPARGLEIKPREPGAPAARAAPAAGSGDRAGLMTSEEMSYL